MKKILSLALASALALGMSVTAFAAGGNISAPAGIDVNAEIRQGTNMTFEVEADTAGEKVTIVLTDGTKVVTNEFSGSKTVVATGATTPKAKFTLQPTKIKEYSALTIDAKYGATNISATTASVGYVKVVAPTAVAGTKGRKITAQLSDYALADKLDVDTKPGDSIKIPLISSMFEVEEDGVVIDDGSTPVTQEMIRNGKVEVRTAISTGSKAISGVALEYDDYTTGGINYKRTATIKVKMVDPFVSVEEADFALVVYLVIGGDRTSYKDLGSRIDGTLSNDITEIWADEHYVDSSKGYVIEAMEYNKNVEVDLGLGVSIHTKMFKDKKYYGIANGDRDEADDVVFAKYPDVDRVFTLKTVGLNSTGDIVKLNLTGDVFFVYNADMKFIGKSNEMLPYSTKYYVANKELAVEDAEVDEEPEVEPDDTEVPSTGGAEAPSNANNNPSTGC